MGVLCGAMNSRKENRRKVRRQTETGSPAPAFCLYRNLSFHGHTVMSSSGVLRIWRKHSIIEAQTKDKTGGCHA
ncbi:hypothetical protein [Extibacter muris]|uniref:hypothetical protein n=1 Tax=Extibacter muris TaxID=1796622 RepID=UPI0011AE67ED|nr:hypothetical protein [Extibacter muris]